jgi:hypothetical protein
MATLPGLMSGTKVMACVAPISWSQSPQAQSSDVGDLFTTTEYQSTQE